MIAQTKYEAVIGIECHVELTTRSKMFCGCANEFGGEPNTKVCPVCLALPAIRPSPDPACVDLPVSSSRWMRVRRHSRMVPSSSQYLTEPPMVSGMSYCEIW